MKKTAIFILGFLILTSLNVTADVFLPGSGDESSAEELFFKVTPDPTSNGVYNFEFDNPDNQQINVTIFNSEGEAVFANIYSSSVNESVDLYWQGEGLFYILVETQNTFRVGRLVVYQ